MLSPESGGAWEQGWRTGYDVGHGDGYGRGFEYGLRAGLDRAPHIDRPARVRRPDEDGS